MSKILIIKHGAFGDMIQATSALEALRQKHATDHITLLTTPTYASLARAMGYFDAILLDPRVSWGRVDVWGLLLYTLRRERFDGVYDLQWSQRVHLYARIILCGRGSTCFWSGVLPGCTYPHPDPQWAQLHAFDRLQKQLEGVGIHNLPLPHLHWLPPQTSQDIRGPYVVFVIGASKAEKCWHPEAFSQLAYLLSDQGYTIVLVGGVAEQERAHIIQAQAPFVVSRVGQTSWIELGQILKNAAGVVGNDTGPTHMAAAAGVPVVALLVRKESPHKGIPMGICVKALYDQPTAQNVDDVLRALIARGVSD